jgi:hypothetical protein
MRTVSMIVCCLLLIAGAAFAQTDRGTITGTIVDSAGAFIPGAVIEAKNTQTDAKYQVASTATGNYTLPQLPAGAYQLSASVPGFKQYIRTGITVLVAQTLRIDIALEVGNLSETVTVNADAPLLRTESGELSHNIGGDRASELPMLAWKPTIRDPYTVTDLVPGTYYQDRAHVRLDGAPSNTQTLRIEGQDATNQFNRTSTPMTNPSLDAVEEFAVQTSNYAAEYGQAGGGLFNITMRSGTNRYHGTAYDYLSNEVLNASTPFVNAKQRTRRNDYGFTLGGPVVIPKIYDGHDKTFFFFNWEQYRENLIVNNLPQQVPTLAYRDGDFRQALTGKVLGKDPLGRNIMEGTIYDPRTERLVNGLRVRDPFPDNTIPKDRFDTVAVRIQALIPVPTSSALTSNYLSPWANPNIRTIPAVKIDHNISTRSKLSFYWSTTSQFQNQGAGAPGGDGIQTPVTTNKPVDNKSYTVRLSLDQTLRPTLLLHLGAGFQGLIFRDTVERADFDQLKELGLPGAKATVFPYITGLTAGRGGMKNMGPNAQSESVMLKPTGTASLTWVKGNHTYKFGGETRIEGYPVDGRYPAYGSYTFGAEQTGLPSTLGQNLQGGTVGFPYASFLLGLVKNGDIGMVSNTRMGKSAWAVFAQDTWKVTRRFTLDYGLRWDYQTYFKEQYGRVSNFSPTAPNPSAGNLPGAVIFEGSGPGRCNCDFAKVYPYSFGPRLGAAYQIAPKTVLRAGFGISYAQTSSSKGSVGSSNPFASPSYGDPAILLQNGPPAPAVWPNLDPGQYPAAGTLTTPPNAMDPNGGRPPRQIQWSIGIQREIFRNLAVELSYVGNRGAWWEGNALIDVNGLTANRISSFGLDVNNTADQLLLAAQLSSALAKQRGYDKVPYASFPKSSTVAQSLRPFPQFGTVNYMWAPLGRTWYDSMQLKVTKRFSHGLDFTSTFTWQKELTMAAEEAGGTNAAVNDVFNRPMNKYISRLSRPIVFVLALNYRLPKWGSNRVLSLALGDWTIGTVLQLSSGLPIRAPVAQNQLSTHLFRSTYANRVPGQPLYTVDINCHSCFDPGRDFVLNPNAWVDPPQGQFGTSAAYYNDYRSMRRPSEAMGIGRIFRIKEKVTLNIRADFNNIFNRTFIVSPTSTNAKATQTRDQYTGKTVSGFGYINTLANTDPISRFPRQGVIVARVQF